MDIREMRRILGDTQNEFSMRYHIPIRTIQDWEYGIQQPPEYMMALLEEKVSRDIINRKTIVLPKYDSNKLDLPKNSSYLYASDWLHAVENCMNEPVVFALDEAMMCQGSFLGRNEEYLVWVYGSDSLTRFNGVIILGNAIDSQYVEEAHGIRFTNFNRTLNDAITNEDILDMQGITEALSWYYYTHDKSFDGLYIPIDQQERFKSLAVDAIEYHTS